MNHQLHRARAALLASLAIALGTLPAACARHDTAQHDSGRHDAHTTGGAAIEQLALEAGQKWQTDEPLRAGMAAVLGAFEAEHAAIDTGSAGDAQYDALAGEIDARVQDIVRNCKLPPAADANLHYIIADLLRGVNEMRGGDPSRTRRDGAVLVHGALEAYGKFFDDPAFGAAAQVP
jgi:hypothetical protein